MHIKKRDLQSALINIWSGNLSTKFPRSHEEEKWQQVLLMSNNEQPCKNVLQKEWKTNKMIEFFFPHGKVFIVKIKSFIILTLITYKQSIIKQVSTFYQLNVCVYTVDAITSFSWTFWGDDRVFQTKYHYAELDVQMLSANQLRNKQLNHSNKKIKILWHSTGKKM